MPYPTKGWLTSGTLAVLELTSASMSPFVLFLSITGSDIVAKVDGVRVDWSLEVNEVWGDEWLMRGEEVWVWGGDDV